MNAELCSGFTISGGDSRTVDVLFMDIDTRDRYVNSLTEWQNEWNNVRLHDQESQAMLAQGQIFIGVDHFSRSHGELLHRVTKAIEREYYWEAATYDLVIHIVTSRPRKRFEYSGTFELSEPEADKLRNNFSKMLIELCGVGVVPHEFVWPKVKWAHL